MNDKPALENGRPNAAFVLEALASTSTTSPEPTDPLAELARLIGESDPPGDREPEKNVHPLHAALMRYRPHPNDAFFPEDHLASM